MISHRQVIKPHLFILVSIRISLSNIFVVFSGSTVYTSPNKPHILPIYRRIPLFWSCCTTILKAELSCVKVANKEIVPFSSKKSLHRHVVFILHTQNFRCCRLLFKSLSFIFLFIVVGRRVRRRKIPLSGIIFRHLLLAALELYDFPCCGEPEGSRKRGR